jgi:hypothetical protein
MPAVVDFDGGVDDKAEHGDEEFPVKRDCNRIEQPVDALSAP